MEKNKAAMLREKYEEDLKSLQDSCPHTDSEWREFMWAPGHFGLPVRVCEECEKILERKEPPQTSTTYAPFAILSGKEK